MNDEEMPIYKVAMIGPSFTGKTSILNYFHLGVFDEGCTPTIGANFLSHVVDNVNGKRIELQIWDTAGQDRYKSIGSQYYRDAHCCIAVYDLTKPSSIQEMRTYVDSYIQCCVIGSPMVVVVGNKLDLTGEQCDGVNMGKEYANDNSFPYYMTSAKNGEGITQLFEFISKTLVTNQAPKVIDTQPQPKQSSKCDC